MANVLVTKRSSTINTNDTYILSTAIPDADRAITVSGALTRNASFDGTATLSARPRGSSGAWKPIAYTNPATGAVSAATFGSADAQFRLDATGLELAFVVTGWTVGSLTLDVTDSPEA